MTRWGLPQRLRVDNGMPWGTGSKLPSALGLWLVGLGVELIYSRPARSTDNAVVERSHGVLNQWVEAPGCADFAACQARLDWAVHTQRERYQLAQGQSRCQLYPQLSQPQRAYCPQQEAQNWSLAQVRTYLSQFRFQRKVEKNGRITLFASSYSVGRTYSRRYLEVYFDPDGHEWVICDEAGLPIRRYPAQDICYDTIRCLKLAKRRRL